MLKYVQPKNSDNQKEVSKPFIKNLMCTSSISSMIDERRIPFKFKRAPLMINRSIYSVFANISILQKRRIK